MQLRSWIIWLASLVLALLVLVQLASSSIESLHDDDGKIKDNTVKKRQKRFSPFGMDYDYSPVFYPFRLSRMIAPMSSYYPIVPMDYDDDLDDCDSETIGPPRHKIYSNRPRQGVIDVLNCPKEVMDYFAGKLDYPSAKCCMTMAVLWPVCLTRQPTTKPPTQPTLPPIVITVVVTQKPEPTTKPKTTTRPKATTEPRKISTTKGPPKTTRKPNTTTTKRPSEPKTTVKTKRTTTRKPQKTTTRKQKSTTTKTKSTKKPTLRPTSATTNSPSLKRKTFAPATFAPPIRPLDRTTPRSNSVRPTKDIEELHRHFGPQRRRLGKKYQSRL